MRYFKGFGGGFLGTAMMLVASSICARGEALNLEQALQGIANNAVYQAQLQKLEVLQGRAEQAGGRPNPTLESELGSAFIEGSKDHVLSIVLSQVWERGGKRQLRRLLAEVDVQLAELEAANYQRTLRWQVQMAFAELVLAEERVALLEDHRQQLQALLAYDELRLEEGEIPLLNVEFLRSHLLRLQSSQQHYRQQRQQARNRLNQLTSAEMGTDYQADRLAPDVSLPPLEETIRLALLNRPDQKKLAVLLEQAQLMASLEEARSKPDWTVGLGYQRIRSRLDADSFQPQGLLDSAIDASNLLKVELKIPLPLWDANGSDRAAALAEQQTRQKGLSAGEDLLRQSVTAAHQEVAAAMELRALSASDLIPGLQNSLEKMEEAYRLTGERLRDVLSQRRELLEESMRALEIAFSVRKAVVELEKETGVFWEQMTVSSVPGQPETPSEGVQEASRTPLWERARPLAGPGKR